MMPVAPPVNSAVADGHYDSEAAAAENLSGQSRAVVGGIRTKRRKVEDKKKSKTDRVHLPVLEHRHGIAQSGPKNLP
jgi:hypothetical protein